MRILMAGSVATALLGHHLLIVADGDLTESVRQHRPDLLLMDAALGSSDLAACLAEPAFLGLPLILVAGPDDADAVGLLLGADIHILDKPATAEAIGNLVDACGAPMGAADSTSPYGPAERIEALQRDAERVAAALAELAAGRPPEVNRPVDAARIRAHVRARQMRGRFLPADLFADPAWDILLDLAAARLEGVKVSVSSLCIAAQVPTTTALRWIKTLVDRDILLREADRGDARRAFIGLAPATATAMQACLDAVLNQPGQ